MSWIKGAKTDFPESLKIQDDMVAYLKFVGEPESWEKAEDDIRYHAKVEYLGGSAVAFSKDKDPHAAEKNEIYTLWLPKTLLGAILNEFGWREGKPAPSLDGSRWKVWRTEEKRGSNRLYGASKMEGEDIANDEILTTVQRLKNGDILQTLKALSKLDHETWKTFLEGKDVPNPEEVTEKMLELGYIRKDEKNIYPVEK